MVDCTLAAYRNASPVRCIFGHNSSVQHTQSKTLFSVWELILAVFDS